MQWVKARLRRRGSRGNMMATIMMVSALAFVATMSMAATSVTNLTVSFRLDNMQRAHDLAESALARGIREILADPTYGTHQETILVDGAPDGTLGILTFDPQCTVNGAHAPLSVNNLQSDNATIGFQAQLIPREGAGLVGIGAIGNVISTAQAVIRVPRFPYAIASSGPVQTTSAILVGAVNNLSDLSHGIDPNQLLPGSVASNASGTSVALAPGSRVTGDVVSVGNASVNGVAVGGQVRAGANPVQMPTIAIPDFNGQQGLVTLNADLVNPPPLQGYLLKPGPLTVTGDLTLNGAALVVQGDLVVNGGGLQGQGAVFVNGRTTITGASHLTTDQVTALVSKGDVQMTGTGQNTSSFTGLVYTEGNFQADSISVVGAFVGNKDSHNGGSQISLNNVNVVQVPNLDPSFSIHTQLGGGFSSAVALANNMTWFQIPTRIDVGATPPDPSVFLINGHYNTQNVDEAHVPVDYTFTHNDFPGQPIHVTGADNAVLFAQLYIIQPDGTVPDHSAWPPGPNWSPSPLPLLAPFPPINPQPAQSLLSRGLPWMAGLFDPTVVSANTGGNAAPGKTATDTNGFGIVTGGTVTSGNGPDAKPAVNIDTNHPKFLYGQIHAPEELYFTSLKDAINQFNRGQTAHVGQPLSLNMSDFIRPSDNARLLLWK